MQRKLRQQIVNAIVADNAEQIKQLVVANSIDVNIVFTAQKITFLMFAAKSKAVKAVRTLLALGADACREDYIGRTASDYALDSGADRLSIILMDEEAKKYAS
jgi:ankyrin repeat protein